MKIKIYLIPGLMNNEELWSRITPLLKETFEFIHIPIPLTASFDEAIKEIETYFQEPKVNLLGFSLGAYMASYITAKKPYRINRVFLVAGTPSSLSDIEVKRRKLTLNQLNNMNFRGLSTKKAQSLLEKENQEDTELIKTIQDMFSSFSLETYKTQMGTTFKRDDIYEELFSLNLPINFLFSAKDKLLNHKSLEKVKDTYKHIAVKKIEGYSHMIPLEKPTLLAEEIINWIKR